MARLAVVPARMAGSAAASFLLSTAIRTTPAPACRRSSAWATVASMSVVCVAVMLWAAIGWPAPIVIEPMRTARVGFLVISTKAGPPGTL